ncbi:hypothetical protein SAMN05428954_1223 [Streptomyces sp. 2112.3]|nr:hypothetical protein SAMN05428954_1223 [Streptomyces sp. 2112.3]
MNTTIAGAPTAAPHRRLERSDRIFVAGRRTPDAGRRGLAGSTVWRRLSAAGFGALLGPECPAASNGRSSGPVKCRGVC